MQGSFSAARSQPALPCPSLPGAGLCLRLLWLPPCSPLTSGVSPSIGTVYQLWLEGGFTLVAASFLGSSGDVFMFYELPLGGRMEGWKARGWWSVRGYCGQELLLVMLRWAAGLAGPSYGPEMRKKPG